MFATFLKFIVFCLWEAFSHHLPLITSHCRVDQKTNTDPSLEAQQPISPEEFNLSLSKYSSFLISPQFV